jgi:hypothetical protein
VKTNFTGAGNIHADMLRWSTEKRSDLEGASGGETGFSWAFDHFS